MDRNDLENIMQMVSRGNTSALEALFTCPGGRKYLERVVLMIVYHLPVEQQEKKDLLTTFQKALHQLEKRIIRQQDGQNILKQVYR